MVRLRYYFKVGIVNYMYKSEHQQLNLIISDIIYDVINVCDNNIHNNTIIELCMQEYKQLKLKNTLYIK